MELGDGGKKVSANTRPSVRPTMTKRNMRSFFHEPFLPLPPLSPCHNTKWKVYNAFPSAADPNVINVVTLSRPFAPSFLACSIPLAHNDEGRQTLFARASFIPVSRARGPLCPLRDDGALSPTHPSTRRDVARHRSCELSQIVASVNHAFDLPSRPPSASSLLRRRSSYLAAASAPPTLIRSPSLSLMFGLGLLWRFSSLRHHASE